jgi:starvation-inducible DNA-binding protein
VVGICDAVLPGAAVEEIPVIEETDMAQKSLKTIKRGPTATPSDLGSNATKDIAGAVNALLADTFALYMKTKNFHWHMSGPHFRDYHLLLDEQAEQIFDMTDVLAERVRKIGGTTLKSIGQISAQQRILDNDANFVTPEDMLAELRDDTRSFIGYLRQVHELCSEHGDSATTSILENYIDESERRHWFLFESTRVGPASV